MSFYINLLAARYTSNIEILLTLAACEPRQMCGIVWSDFGGPLQCIQCSDVKGAFVSWDRLHCGNRLPTLNITLAFFRHQHTFSYCTRTCSRSTFRRWLRWLKGNRKSDKRGDYQAPNYEKSRFIRSRATPKPCKAAARLPQHVEQLLFLSHGCRTADSLAWRNVYPLDLMSGILMRFIGAERALFTHTHTHPPPSQAVASAPEILLFASQHTTHSLLAFFKITHRRTWIHR